MDANGRTSTLQYDPLGRLVKVWTPGRDTLQSPTVEYAGSPDTAFAVEFTTYTRPV